jgi:glycosyltransferase involved in cell wall biosynthesis
MVDRQRFCFAFLLDQYRRRDCYIFLALRPFAAGDIDFEVMIMVRVAYIYTTPHFSGAAVSMAESLSTLGSAVCPTIISPKGSATDYFERRLECRIFETGHMSQFDHTRFGRYRGMRWLVALRELILLPATWFAIRRFALAMPGVDIIHLNEITGIIAAVMLKRRLRLPLVVHVRAHMGEQSKGLRSAFLRWLFARYVDEVVCIDETVRASLPQPLRDGAVVIHNGLKISREAATPSDRKLPSGSDTGGIITVGMVGSLLRVKGVYEFVEAAIAISKMRDDVRFVLYGTGVRALRGVKGAIISYLGLADDVEGDLRRAIDESGLSDRIELAGHRNDLATVYQEIDILCFPSHYNAPGRPIFEAAYFGKPSIVAIDAPLADTLIDGKTGVAVDAKCPQSLKAAIIMLLDNPTRREEMGAAARRLAARNFDVRANAAALLTLYERAIDNAVRQLNNV